MDETPVPTFGTGDAVLVVEDANLDEWGESDAGMEYVSVVGGAAEGEPDRVVVAGYVFGAEPEYGGGIWVLPPGARGSYTPGADAVGAWILGEEVEQSLGDLAGVSGEFDGDGSDDLAFGLSSISDSEHGDTVGVVSGVDLPASGEMPVSATITNSIGTHIDGVASVEDLDGDGLSELAISVRMSDSSTPDYLCWGPFHGDLTLDDCQPQVYGAGVFLDWEEDRPRRVGGDVNGDGYNDALVRTADGRGVLFGGEDRTLGLNRVTTEWIDDPEYDPGLEDRAILSPHSDVDGDGRDDVVLTYGQSSAFNTAGEDAWDEVYARGRGAVYLFANVQPGTYPVASASLTVWGAPDVAGFGRDAHLADLDNTGFADLVVSFDGLRYVGTADVISHEFSAYDGAVIFRDPPLLPGLPLTIADASALLSSTDDDLDFGESIDVLDHDGDGFLDVLVGGKNQAWVFSGADVLGL